MSSVNGVPLVSVMLRSQYVFLQDVPAAASEVYGEPGKSTVSFSAAAFSFVLLTVDARHLNLVSQTVTKSCHLDCQTRAFVADVVAAVSRTFRANQGWDTWVPGSLFTRTWAEMHEPFGRLAGLKGTRDDPEHEAAIVWCRSRSDSEWSAARGGGGGGPMTIHRHAQAHRPTLPDLLPC